MLKKRRRSTEAVLATRATDPQSRISSQRIKIETRVQKGRQLPIHLLGMRAALKVLQEGHIFTELLYAVSMRTDVRPEIWIPVLLHILQRDRFVLTDMRGRGIVKDADVLGWSWIWHSRNLERIAEVSGHDSLAPEMGRGRVWEHASLETQPHEGIVAVHDLALK